MASGCRQSKQFLFCMYLMVRASFSLPPPNAWIVSRCGTICFRSHQCGQVTGFCVCRIDISKGFFHWEIIPMGFQIACCFQLENNWFDLGNSYLFFGSESVFNMFALRVGQDGVGLFLLNVLRCSLFPLKPRNCCTTPNSSCLDESFGKTSFSDIFWSEQYWASNSVFVSFVMLCRWTVHQPLYTCIVEQ